ncbi:MerC domain-containing protein [Chitinophaga arvensicola]|uniref:MerC mercury resistance protein n=1 Tax=Chitinophaga arvensicola TaxID=29529 RepID=A0A1I0PUH2_9BACT|nr:MerC domain-containing protein [Chitinophaga arvensicola]SEW18116.1 MerC mercury resistance protein [Chitinophaga arvensicola]
MELNILKKMNLDSIGIGASVLCAVHCAVLPLMLTVLPLLGSHVLENEKLEYGLLSFSFAVGCFSLGRGYLRHHRRLTPMLLFAVGFALLLGGHFVIDGGYWEPAIIFAGAVGITGAHILNLRRCKECAVGHKQEAQG